ncbi:MAG: transcription repressor NadR [Ruminococcaceae bacterium]|nr:transcription repressor NadR [Oscillospiraceae bacterium]
MRSDAAAVARRRELVKLLSRSKTALTGNELAEHFKVSRQSIIKDISFLRKEGKAIVATEKGYYLDAPSVYERVFKLFHTADQTKDELRLVVGMGGVVKDVFVWHKVYGRVKATLNISCQEDVDRFIDGVRSGKSSELMNITGGYHYHTVTSEEEEVLDRIAEALNQKGFIADGI